MDIIKPKDWDALNAALQKIAKAQNAMRKRLEIMEGQLADLLPSLADLAVEASASTGMPAPGVFVPSPNCKVCGQNKEPGRVALTCNECAAKRQTILRTKDADRTSIVFAACVNCSTPKKAHTTMLCSPCSGAFKQWKIDHGV